MSVVDLLTRLQRQEIRLWLEGDRLRFSAPPGALTQELRDEIGQHRAEIITVLRNSQITETLMHRQRTGDEVPMTFAQLRYWLLDQLTPENPAHNIPIFVRLIGPLQIPALERALNALTERHEILRTTFELRGGTPCQVIHPVGPQPLYQEDLRSLPETEREAVSQTRSRELGLRPFDLKAGPLLHAGLLRLADEESLLVLTIHHIVADGWSLSVLIRELMALYDWAVDGTAPLPKLQLQYADYALWEHEKFDGEGLRPHLDYWKGKLAGAPPMVNLPTDAPRSDPPEATGARQDFSMARATAEALNAACRKYETTQFIVLLAAFYLALFRWSGQDDVVLGTVVANRTRTELESMIGCFVNFLALRGRLSEGMTGVELLQQVKKTVLEGYARQDCPYDKVVEAVLVERHPNQNPLYNIVFQLQNIGVEETFVSRNGLRTEFAENPAKPPALIDLRLMVFPLASGDLFASCDYNGLLFSDETVRRFLEFYQTAVDQLVGRPEAALSGLELPATLKAQAQAARARDRELTLAVAATFTAEPLESGLAYWMRTLGIPAKVAFAPYNQVFQELLAPQSLLAQNGYGFNVLLIRFEDWRQAEAPHLDLVAALQGAAARSATPYLVVLCPPSPATLADPALEALDEERTAWIAEQLARTGGVYVITPEELLRYYPLAPAARYDPYTDELGHIPFTPPMFAALAMMLARKIYALRRPPAKVIVLDCDNTLWKGVAGEDGPMGIEISTPWRVLQEQMVAQHQAGKLLALCSHNNEETVWEVFEQRPEMPLRREHLVTWRINWLPKSQNIRAMAEELQLGLDSFIFIDDNPVVCAEVQANCPEVLTLQLPTETELIPQFFQHLWALDLLKVTAEDRQRTEMYRQNLARERLQRETLSFGDFLANLGLEILLEPMTPGQLPRVSQLTQRTNQFNCTTIRRSEGEIQELLRTGALECLTTRVRDRFGDYGLVGATLFGTTAGALVVDTFLLSCRALGRGVEHRIVAHLGELALERGLERVEIPFRPTRKNRPALDFLEQVGGDYKEAKEPEGFSFVLPAAYAAGVVFAPTGEAPAAVEESSTTAVASTAAVPAGRQRKLAELLRRIALEFASPMQTLAVLEAERRLRPDSLAPYAPPRTPLEEQLAAIWRQVLGLERVGLYDDFFQLGGHSLLATQVISRIRQAFETELSLQIFFENSTVAQLAGAIEKSRQQAQKLAPIHPLPAGAERPLSFAQQRLWFLSQLEPESPIYNVPAALRLHGTLNVEALELSLKTIVERHETLRTTFVNQEGRPTAVIAATAEAPLVQINLEMAAADLEVEARRVALVEMLRPFDLTCELPFRAALLRLSETEHWLVLTMHHIASDGWSLGVLVRELTALYAAFCAGKPNPLAGLAVQYGDFAGWQREWLQGERLEAQQAYWQQQLRGAPPRLELPTDHPRPAQQSSNGARQLFYLPRSLAESLRALSQAHGATLFMTLLAAFDALLYRYTGQTDVVVGSPIANRNRVEIEPLIGFFVNTLALRLDLAGDPTFVELLGRAREATLGAFAHQDLPFEMLMDGLHIERSLSHTPLFQVMFVLQNAPMPELQLGDLSIQGMAIESGTAQFDLTMSLVENDDGLRGALEYNTDLFEAETAARLVGYFQTLLAGAAAAPGRRLSELPLLSEAEQRRLLELSCGPQAPAADWSLTARFAEQAARTPEATAVYVPAWEGRPAVSVSYAELNERADRLALWLNEEGIGSGALAAICLERSPEAMAALLGILKAGAAYLPLNPAYPAERLAYMVQDSGAALVLTERRWGAALPEGVRVVYLDREFSPQRHGEHREEGKSGEEWKSGRLEVGTAGEDAAYAIYTSGSTGRPKGVVTTRRALANHCQAIAARYGLQASDRVLQFAALSFDVAAEEIFPTWLCGATVVLCPEELTTAPEAFTAFAAAERLTVLNLPTPYWYAWTLALEQRDESLPAAVRLVVAGSEKVLVEQLQRWQARVGAAAAWYNAYGLTEATITTTVYEPDLREAVPGSVSGTVPVGRPIANTHVYILGPRLQLQPPGVPGEVYIGGDSLARGYPGRPGLTAERFIPDPFSRQPGARIYRTGDLARRRADGELEFLGRADQQVKIRGFRIELGEVEAVLSEHPAVGQATVILFAPAQNPEAARLAAYVELREGVEAPGVDELRAFMKERLPDYMVPAHYMVLAALPLTANGKVDRRALPEPEGGASDGENGAVENPLVEVVQGIFAQLLGVERVGAQANFFELGGHSLLATQVISRVRDYFKVELPLRKIFEASTATALAAEIATALQGGVEIAPLVPVSREGELPLSFSQQRLWFLDQLAPDNPAYNSPTVVRLRGQLDRAALEGTLRQIVQRHEALRTTFPEFKGAPRQVIAAEAVFELPLRDLSELPAERREAEAERVIHEEAVRPFSLAAGPLVRGLLVRLAVDDHVLILNMHHIISDGWSVGVLVDEWQKLYTAAVRGTTANLPALPIQYADFAAWQRAWLQGEVLEAQLGYWKEKLAGAPAVLDLPLDYPRPPKLTWRGATERFVLPAELRDGLQALSRREGATLFMTLLAAFNVLLGRYARQSDVVVGSPIAGRNRSEIERLIGFFVNTLALRTDLSGNPSFATLLARVRETTLGAYMHQELPFERLVDELHLERKLSHSPLFQVMFVLQNTPDALLELPELTLESFPLERGTTLFDLTLIMGETEDGLGGVLEYNADLFKAGTIQRMAGHLVQLLEQVVKRPQMPIEALELLTPIELTQFEQWNATAMDFGPMLILQEVEAQAAAHPESPAVVDGARVLSYGELNGRADRLATYLRQQGVGPEVVTALYLERSAELAIGALAILKAGGAYLPIDPAYPAARAAMMVEETQSPVVLTISRLRGQLPATARGFCMDSEWESLPTAEMRVSPVPFPEQAAYVIYTSGSTGKPKGVVVPHRGLANIIHWFTREFEITAADRASHLAGVGFDAAVMEIWGTLANGATLVVVDPALRAAPEALRDWMTAQKITLAFMPSPIADVAMTLPWGETTLRRVYAGGDRLHASPPEGAPFRLNNCYGPTENSVVSAAAWIPTLPAGELPSIGSALANVQLYVLDEAMRQVPVGVIGELYAGGMSLARGYFRRPDQTAERFVPDPFGGEPGSRLYRTGDLVRRQPDGTLDFIGRNDFQVKIRGFRIELGEIESALAGCPEVEQSAVVVYGPEGVQQLAAYYAPRPGTAPTTESLRSYLLERLPGYMVPATFIQLAVLPLTSNGKVDRKALPVPEPGQMGRDSYVAPGTPVEESLAQIMAEVLKRERVGINDNFFEMGGHSLLATQVLSRVRETLAVELPLSALFEAPTVHGLAEAIIRQEVDLADDDLLAALLAELE